MIDADEVVGVDGDDVFAAIVVKVHAGAVLTCKGRGVERGAGVGPDSA